MKIYNTWEEYYRSEQDAYLDEENGADEDVNVRIGDFWLSGSTAITSYSAGYMGDRGTIFTDCTAADVLAHFGFCLCYTADRETGTFIDEFYYLEDAKKAILEYEDEDRRNGEYTPDFYDIVNADHESIRE